MVWAEEAITIARPCEAVFALVSDVSRMSEWRATLVEVEWGVQGPVQVGQPFRAVTKVAGRRFAWECEVTEWDPPESFGYLARGVAGNGHEVAVRWHLVPVAEGCRLTMAGGGELPGRIAGMAAPVFARLLMRENRKALQELRRLAEEGRA